MSGNRYPSSNMSFSSYPLLGKKITVLGSRQVFEERIFLQMFLHNALHFGVRQRIQKLILYQILDINSCISFINKGVSIFQKPYVQCDALKVIWFGININ